MNRRFVQRTLAALTASFYFAALPPTVAEAARHLMCDGHIATIVGTPGADRIRGTARSDVIVALAGDDVIEAQAGSHGDVICAGHGDDTINTGAANDAIFGGHGNDLIGPGGGHNVVTGGPDEDAVYGGPDEDVIEGGYGNDYLEGGLGSNVVKGGPGADSLVSDGRRDRLRGGPGGDQIGAFEDNDRAGASAGDLPGRDVVHGGPGGDRIGDFDPDDDVYGGSGEDFLFGHLRPGSDQVVDGGSGSNGLILTVAPRPGGRRWSRVSVNLTRDRVAADDVVSRFAGRFHWVRIDIDGPANDAHSWTIVGTASDDTLEAFFLDGRVLARGRAGDDVLVTGSGDDTLHGGSGSDSGSAGPGRDTCFSIESVPLGDTDAQCETSTP